MSGVDAHHHVWRLARGDYGWLQPTSALAAIYRDFALDELRPQLAAADINATVLVQAAPTIAETHFLLELAKQSGGLVRGVVGWVDLGARDAVQALSDLVANSLLKGVRPMLHDLADPAWILRAEVQPALMALPALGLRFDALVRPRELAALRAMLVAHPDLDVIVDHCAKPDIAGGGWQPWAADIAAIASQSAAYCKLSGLVTEAGSGWTVDALRRYVDHVVECFGVERVIWGSDWPVLTLAASYAEWHVATESLLAALSAGERAAVRGGNARRFYGFDA
ncbi:MAG: amidohydrolase family protein [Casimicrobiaceae bacterium]